MSTCPTALLALLCCPTVNVLPYQVTMVNSKQLTNKSKSTPKMSLRSRSVMQNTPTTSVQSHDNSDETVNTIRGIIKEELEKHEKELNEILKSQLQNTNERLDKISNEVLEITKSLEFTQGELDEELVIVKNDISKIKSDIQILEDDLLDPNEVSKKLIELQDRSRRDNLRFDGLTEDPNKTWDDCERKVQDVLLNNLNIEDNIEIDRCHCFGKGRGSHPRTIICRFLRFKDKQKILQNAKKINDTGIFINEDFCSDTMELRKSLWEKVLEHHRQGNCAYLNYRTIVVRDKS